MLRSVYDDSESPLSNETPPPAPSIHLDLEFRHVDTVLAVFYGGACFFSFWAFAKHMCSSQRQPPTLGFYLLLGLCAFIRVVWFSTPYGVLSVLVEPERLRKGDNGWRQFLASEIVERLGSILLYSVFMLIVVFWADMLRRLFTHETSKAPRPMRLFGLLVLLLASLQAIGVGIFLCQRADSYWLMMYNDTVLGIVSLLSLAAVLVYSYRMKTVLQAFLEVSQIDTTDRIKAVNWATTIGAAFLITHSVFLGYSLISLAKFHQAGAGISSKWWWLFVASKHVVEVLVLYFLLYTLWGDSRDEAESKDGYEPIPDGLTDDEVPRTSGSMSSTPRRY